MKRLAELLLIWLCVAVYCSSPVTGRAANTQLRDIGENGAISISDWFHDHLWIYGVIGGVVLGIVAVVGIVIVIFIYCYRKKRRDQPRRKPSDRTSLLSGSRTTYSKLPAQRAEIGVDEEFNRQKRRQQTQDKERAVMAVNFYLRNNQQYELETDLSDMGSRIQKYWFKVTTRKDGQTLLLSIAPVSHRCPLKLDQSTLKTVKSLFGTLQGHPYIHPIMVIEYFQDQVIIVQPFCTRGSLKDVIYKSASTTDWSMKYSRRSKGLSAEKIANYGRQILEAMVFLYKQGFPVLGHVQSGNIFVQDSVCRLGGYENTLLGYKTRLYKLCKECLDKMDVIMFGHLLFEMSCGYELVALVPGEQEYRSVKHESVKQVLQFIFDGGIQHSIEEVLTLEFFQFGKASRLQDFNPSTVKLTSSMKSLLKQVEKGKPQKQKTMKQKKTLVSSGDAPYPNSTQSAAELPKTSLDSGQTSSTGNRGSGD